MRNLTKTIEREQMELDGGFRAPVSKGAKKIPVRAPGIGIEGVREQMDRYRRKK